MQQWSNTRRHCVPLLCAFLLHFLSSAYLFSAYFLCSINSSFLLLASSSLALWLRFQKLFKHSHFEDTFPFRSFESYNACTGRSNITRRSASLYCLGARMGVARELLCRLAIGWANFEEYKQWLSQYWRASRCSSFLLCSEIGLMVMVPLFVLLLSNNSARHSENYSCNSCCAAATEEEANSDLFAARQFRLRRDGSHKIRLNVLHVSNLLLQNVTRSFYGSNSEQASRLHLLDVPAWPCRRSTRLQRNRI